MATHQDGRPAAARSAADWLCLAAAPTFAVMALLTAVFGGGAPDLLCAAAHGSPLSGMVPMYLLMSAFHAAPWLRLISASHHAASRNSRSAAAMSAKVGSECSIPR
jgi:hypothetical protein